MRETVCNASPLILLAKADLLGLMPKLFERAFVPEAVLDEIMAGPADDPMRQAIPHASWLIRVRVDPPFSPPSLWALDRGEAEVIEYARLHHNVPVLLDDRKARRVAERLGLSVNGTMGIVATAVNRGFVGSFRASVGALRAAGLYISDEIIEVLEKQLASGK